MSNLVRTCSKCGQTVPEDAPQGLCPKCVIAEAAAHTEPHSAPGHPDDVPSLESVSAAFPHLEVLELIGRGGMGFVFKARQPHLDRFVALKILQRNLARDPQFAERFHREGKFLARLSHPNIVSVYDFGQANGFYFLLMECVDGVNLRQAMQAGRFSPAEALGVVPKICEALQYAHEQGVLHRDIKPENILLDSKGRVKIADFGIAKMVGEDKAPTGLTNTGAALGTPHYMAPEQLEKPGTVDHRADIYSLGVVFYEMLTGELPLGRFAAPSAKTPVDARVDEVVMRSLEREREKRFQSANEVKTRVEGISRTPPPPIGEADTGRAPGAGAWPLPSPAPRHSVKAIVAAALGGLGLVMAGGPLLFAFVGAGAIGFYELVLVMFPGSLCLLAGSVLGFLALSDIRNSGGQIEGRPLAIFAAAAFPVLIVLALTLGVPALFLHLASSTNMPGMLFVLLLVLLFPAGAIALLVWALRRLVRRTGPPVSRRPALWPWPVFGLLLFLFLLALFATLFFTISSERVVTEGVALAPVQGASASQMAADGGRPAAVLPTGAPADPSVVMEFTRVALVEDQNQTWLALEYRREGPGGNLVFQTRGSFPGATVEFREEMLPGAEAAAAPGATATHRTLMLLPSSLGTRVFEQVRAQTTEKWLNRSLVVQAGDSHTLLSVPSGNGALVEVMVSLNPGTRW